MILLAAASPARSILNEQPFGTFVSDYTGGYQLHAVDLNADGALDLVAGSINYSAIKWALGPGPTTLANPVDLGGNYLLGLLDFDQDGLQDLILNDAILFARPGAPPILRSLSTRLDYGDKAVIFRNHPRDPVIVVKAGNSTTCFTAQLIRANLEVSDSLRECLDTDLTHLAIGEVNGDGLTDLILTLGATGEVHVWLGLGSGRFRPAARQALPGYAWNATAFDLDQDGVQEVWASQRFSRELAAYRFDSGLHRLARYAIPTLTKTLKAADLDLDGNLDLYGPTYANSIWIGYGDGDGGLREQATVPLAIDPRDCSAGDFNQDGLIDLATLDPLQIAFATAPREWDFGSRFTPFESESYPTVHALLDLDADGRLEIVTTTYQGADSPRSFQVFRADENLDLQLHQQMDLELPRPVLRPPLDFDRDGDLDILVTSALCSSYDQACQIQVLQNDGDGQFVSLAPVVLSEVRYSLSMTAADLNGDRLPDLAVYDSRRGKLLFHKNRGAGAFSYHSSLDVPSLSQVHSADIDRDGRFDLVGVSLPHVWYLHATGPFQFELTRTRLDDTSYYGSELADMNGDGHHDLLTSQFVHLGIGNGTFSQGRIPIPSSGGYQIQVADADADGDLDILYPWSVLLWESGRLLSVRPLPFRSSRYALAGDLDGDGLPDLVGANYYDPPGIQTARGRGPAASATGFLQDSLVTPAYLSLLDGRTLWSSQ
ncbi:MAG TPA: VCBS repeat-containing protein [Acidobacteriota bacterium]